VIDGRRTRTDYVYMHLRGNGLVSQGARVGNGERIAKVGRSGNATGCHLHFEMWTKPGWYEGGHFMRSVTKHLRRWDRAS
jgi:murein DD-endopeptidase MepM/ murein hydrolase activator NlpD